MDLDNLYVIVENVYGISNACYTNTKTNDVYTKDEIESLKISFDVTSGDKWVAQSLLEWGDEMKELGNVINGG